MFSPRRLKIAESKNPRETDSTGTSTVSSLSLPTEHNSSGIYPKKYTQDIHCQRRPDVAAGYFANEALDNFFQINLPQEFPQ